MLHARADYNRIQDPAVNQPELLSPGSTAIAIDEPADPPPPRRETLDEAITGHTTHELVAKLALKQVRVWADNYINELSARALTDLYDIIGHPNQR